MRLSLGKNKLLRRIGFFVFILIHVLLISILIYGYNSGSCKRELKNYECTDTFCLFKELKIDLPSKIRSQATSLLDNKSIQKRVSINMYLENIYNCAVPNKDGITISTQNINKVAPEIIQYYQKDLCQLLSNSIGLKLFPTDLTLPTSCALLIYEREGDWINWHYDYNYYNGRFFTVLIPLTNDITCTEFQYMDDDKKVHSIQLINNNALCFEGNFLYHRATKLCKGQKRAILSVQYVTDNTMSLVNQMRIKLKDFAYIGKLF